MIVPSSVPHAIQDFFGINFESRTTRVKTVLSTWGSQIRGQLYIPGDLVTSKVLSIVL